MKFFQQHSRFLDFLVLAIRFLLAFMMFSYGFGKIFGGQFGLNEINLSKPISELSKMQIGWYLFDFQPFKYFIGISQVICGILLIFNRTQILGALLFLPIIINILVIDLTIMEGDMRNAFMRRLSFYIIFDLILLFHFRDKVLEAFRSITFNIKPKFNYKIWVYLLIPLLAMILEFSSAIPKFILAFLKSPDLVIKYIQQTFEVIKNLF